MKPLRVISLRLWLPVLVGAAFILSTLVIILSERQTHESELISRSIQFINYDLNALVQDMERELSFGNVNDANHALSIRGVNAEYKTLVAVDKKGRVQFSTHKIWLDQLATIIPHFDSAHFRETMEEHEPDIWFSDDRQRITAYFPIMLGHEPDELRSLHNTEVGALFLVYDLSYAQQTLWAGILRSSRIPIFLGFQGFLLLMFILKFYVTRPLQHLLSVTQQLTRGKLGIESKLSGKGELAELGTAFNYMSQQLKHDNAILRRSEQRQQEIIWGSNVGTWEWNIQTGETIINERWAEIVGYTLEELTPMNFDTWCNLIHQDDLKQSNELLEKLLSCELDYYESEARFRHKNGQWVWVLARGKVIEWSEEGKPLRMSGTHTDVSGRKQVEEALRKSEKKYRSLLETSPDGMVIVNAKGEIVIVNQQLRKMTGYTYDDLAGYPVEILVPERFKSHKQHRDGYLDDPHTRMMGKNLELFVRCKDGSEFPAEISLSPLESEDELSISSIRDITERKKTEQAIKKSELMLSEAQRIAQVGSWEFDALLNRRVWSDEMCRIFEVESEHSIPSYEAYLNIVHPDDRVRFDKVYMDAINKHLHHYEIEHRLMMKDGRVKHIRQICKNTFDEYGKLIRAVGTVIDTTHKMELEEQLRRSQKMDAIGQLAGGIAHDFNNLLGILQTNFEFLHDFDIKDDKFQQWINTGLKTVQRGASLTRRLLRFSNVDVMETKEVYINEFITELKELLAKSMTPTIEIKLNLGEDVWQVDIDTNEFQDALVNLSLNARDAMPNGGILQITTSNQQLDEQDIQFDKGLKVGNYMVVSISDTGCGMDREIQERGFEPFFTTKATEKGTGLGLSMVYGFAKRSRGFVRIYSKVGHGTTVRLYLPIFDRRQKMRDENNTEKNAMPGGTETILVVEDETELLEGIKHRLESLGYQVLTASNGHEALAVINSHKEQIALLFSDVVMPGGMNGYELVQEVEKRELGIKILLASGFTDNIPKKNDLSNSHLNVMEKPYTKMGMATRIRESLDSD